MDIVKILQQEADAFFGYGGLLDLLQKGDYSKLRTWDGIQSIAGPIIPLLLVIEIIRALVYKRFSSSHYKITMLIYVFNRFIGRFISIAVSLYCFGLFSRLAFVRTTFSWYWFIYGYIVWELSHFVYHYLGHKVRLFWCLHSTHHTPEQMNLTVSFAHFFLEGAYADIIRVSICALLGVNLVTLGVIVFIDSFWGTFIHAGENLIKDGRLGFLNNIILTPSHHRVHHAKNPLYMDTNFCNLLNIWDRVFRTYRLERKDLPPVYGITREMNPGSFLDVYFGEFLALGKDIHKAPGLVNKFLYIVMPPGWSHTGQHKTSKAVRAEWLREQEKGAGIREQEKGAIEERQGIETITRQTI
jgi:sterol desaturase/sphingolipid hydroxylase (fatty acid hydroxylase superfamily)